ncbi:hypothetical protein RSAG8_11230, partial [Rhizoctonia solani AG-8 WAC10335]
MSNPTDILELARRRLQEAEDVFEEIAGMEVSHPLNPEESRVADALFTKMTNFRKVLTSGKEAVKGWKKKRASTNRVQGSSAKRPRPAPESDEDDESLVLVGSPSFKDEVKKAIKKPNYTAQEWFQMILEGNGGTMFQEATSGLYMVATGIANLPTQALNETVEETLKSPTASEVMELTDQTRIAEIDGEDLYRRYKGGKSFVVRQAYQARCTIKGIGCDYQSPKFLSFAKKYKDYNTGANRFLDAYLKLRSAVLICPPLHIQRFLSSRLGPKLKEAVHMLSTHLTLEKEKREKVNRKVLVALIGILVEDEDARNQLLVALADVDQTIDASSGTQSNA